VSPLAVLNGGGWQLVFERHDDRIRHRIEVPAAGGWRTLIESVEGTASAWWPPSPPLQSLHVESRSTGSVALLVGMAGRSHWSASVEIAGDGEEAVFDFACRAPAAPDWLGCRYRAEAQQPVDAAQETLCVGRHAVRFRGLEPQPLRIARDVQGGIEICAVPTSGRWPQTVRWRYAARVGGLA
jgi:hypothetical protein